MPNREKGYFKYNWHRVVELTGIRPVQDGSTCSTGTHFSVPSFWGLGSGLVSQVPCLSDALGVVGGKTKTPQTSRTLD